MALQKKKKKTKMQKITKKKDSIKKKTNKKKSRITSIKRIMKTNPAKKIFLTSGSKSLDRLLGKGIVEGTSVLILGAPHSGKKPILMKMVKDNCCEYGISPIIILTDLGVSNWIAMAEKNNWSCNKKICNIFYIDSYSQQFNVCSASQNVKCLEVPFTLSSLSISVSEYIDKIKKEGKKPLVVLHSISTLIETFGTNEVFSFLRFFLGKLRNEGVTIVSTMQLGVHGENLETAISSLNECVIKLKDNKLNASGYLTIRDNNWHTYKFVKNQLVLID
ncbi:MAG: ATPase domain-containing protein [Candidatus Micrarchaeia archaeon]